MYNLEDLNNKNATQIRSQIFKTQTALTQKSEQLKAEMQSAFTRTENSVKEKVEDIKQLFDLHYQIERRPWTFLAGAVATGVLIGKLITSASRDLDLESQESHNGQITHRNINSNYYDEMLPLSPNNNHKSQSILSRIANKFGDELTHLKSVSTGALFATLRELAKSSIPKPFSEKIGHVFDEVTEQLGGKIIPPSTQKSYADKVVE
jgi:ElaB/YqjD/DUF883 family membrane-anchored ribosome-binding protein